MTRLTFLGDVFLPEPYTCSIKNLGQYVLNMEYPITQASKGYPGKINLRARDNYLKETFGHPPAAVCLGNNHILDYEEKGFEDTLQVLQRDGVKYFGAGYSRDNCNNPAYIHCAKNKVALLGYVCRSTSPVFTSNDQPGVLPIDIERIGDDIQNARAEGARRVVISLHWGAEEVHLPKPADVKIARTLIDAGTDLIIGHHAHRIQSWEQYKGKYIFYGLGNCIFPNVQVESHYSEETGLPTRLIAKRMKYWNKRSIAVVYDPANNGVRLRKLYFDGRSLRASSRESSAGDNELDLTAGYARKFHRSFVWGKAKAALVNFLYEPKLPRVRHLKSLVTMAGTTNYK